MTNVRRFEAERPPACVPAPRVVNRGEKRLIRVFNSMKLVFNPLPFK